MISNKIESALNEQINAELWSGYLYLSMSLNAARNGLPGLSHWMYVQWHEEQDHARMLQLYMLSQNCSVELTSIASVPTDWDDAREMLSEALLHEQEVTSMINELMSMAADERDYATMNRLRWFVDEQIEEEENLRELIASLQMVGECSTGEYVIDQQMLKRKDHVPMEQ